MSVALYEPVRRPALRWFGGKWTLAPRLIELFPPHRIYVEPFGGAASVLLRKPRSYAEVYNDLDDEVVNLFRVLRGDRAAELHRAVELTPFARVELAEAYEMADDDVERARRLIVRSYQGYGSDATTQDRRTGFRSDSHRSGTTPARDWANYADALPAIIARLRGVTVENRPALQVMQTHDGPETLHYVDPPYHPDTRKSGTYRHELEHDQHVELLAGLCELEGAVILSGYRHALYDEALRDWRRIDLAHHADGGRKRVECVWLSPNAEQAPSLFSLGADVVEAGR